MGLFGSILKTAIHVATTPIDLTKDVVTMGGVLSDKNTSYTEDKLKKLGKDLKQIEKNIDKL